MEKNEGLVDDVTPVLPARPWNTAKAVFIINELERSGLSVAQFAERHGFKPHDVYRWRTKLKVRSNKRVPNIVPVRLVTQKKPPKDALPKPCTCEIELLTPRGFTVKMRDGVDVMRLQSVLRALGEIGC